MNQKTIIITIVIAVVAAGAGFYGGTVYQKSKINLVAGAGQMRGGNAGNRMGGQGAGGDGQHRGGWGPVSGQGGNNMNGDFAAGEIISKDDKSITIKTRDGGSKIVYFSELTKIGKAVEGNQTDLSNGQQVMVNGKNNADGSVVANNIQIRPAADQGNTDSKRQPSESLN